LRRRILYLAEAPVISLEIWMGLMASLIYGQYLALWISQRSGKTLAGVGHVPAR
jgi:hypothetical protein